MDYLDCPELNLFDLQKHPQFMSIETLIKALAQVRAKYGQKSKIRFTTEIARETGEINIICQVQPSKRKLLNDPK